MKKLIILGAALLMLVSVQSYGQKWKNKTKDKHFEPVVKENSREYAGKYVGIESSYSLEIQAGADGRLTINVYENGRKALLKDISFDKAKLTATKVYEDGTTAKFEGEFVNRVLNGQTAFGIIVDGPLIVSEDLVLKRIFYTKQ
ncbi:MAG: hypothetical protein WCB68_24435 [Pyrinomonadaceae bacterium]